MSPLTPFYVKSLKQMRNELGELDKGALTWVALEQLLPKYRDGLVGSGAYNSVSRLLSGSQYVTDLDHLDALRLETIAHVNAAIAVMEQGTLEKQLQTPVPEKTEQPSGTRAPLRNFIRRIIEAFRAKDAIAQLTLASAVFVSVAGGIIWFVNNYDRVVVTLLQYVRPHDRSAGENKAATTIFLDCNSSIFPKVFPTSGRIYFTYILPSLINDQVSLGLGYRFGIAGAAALPDNVTEWAYECTLTNYGNSPVFNVAIPVQVTFREALRPTNQPSGWQSGSIKADKQTSIAVAKIDAGKDNPFVFYLSSQSPDFVELQFLDRIKLQEGSDQDAKLARLIVTASSWIRLAPYEMSQKNIPSNSSPR